MTTASFQLPESLKSELSGLARAEKRTLSNYIVKVLEEIIASRNAPASDDVVPQLHRRRRRLTEAQIAALRENVRSAGDR